MYTYEEIKPQNKQDAFAAMYLCITRSIRDLCGQKIGERIIREAVRRAGHDSGMTQRQRLLKDGLKTNIQNLYHCDCDVVADPRFRENEIFNEEERQIWEVYTCPLADYWTRRDGWKEGSFYCEEYQHARVLAFTDGVGQVNLSTLLTCPRDNCCRFSVYFREANMSPERAKEAFAHCDPSYCAPASIPSNTNLDESICRMTIALYCRLMETAEDLCGQDGVCAAAEGLKRWALVALQTLHLQAEHTLLPMNMDFVRLNFPLALDPDVDGAIWGKHKTGQAMEIMKKLVLYPIAKACKA